MTTVTREPDRSVWRRLWDRIAPAAAVARDADDMTAFNAAHDGWTEAFRRELAAAVAETARLVEEAGYVEVWNEEVRTDIAAAHSRGMTYNEYDDYREAEIAYAESWEYAADMAEQQMERYAAEFESIDGSEDAASWSPEQVEADGDVDDTLSRIDQVLEQQEPDAEEPVADVDCGGGGDDADPKAQAAEKAAAEQAAQQPAQQQADGDGEGDGDG